MDYSSVTCFNISKPETNIHIEKNNYDISPLMIIYRLISSLSTDTAVQTKKSLSISIYLINFLGTEKDVHTSIDPITQFQFYHMNVISIT